MFMCSFSHTVDPKGRVFIPAKWRDALGASVVLTGDPLFCDNRGCLTGMTFLEWQKQTEKMALVPKSDRAAYKAVRITLSYAAECDIDKQGRILLPQNLRDFAQIGESAQIIGMIDHFEIWTPESFDNYKGMDIEDMDKTAEALGRYGL